MKYNFDESVERRGTNCVKWDESADPDIIPMWVADMDFRVAPAIQKALEQRVSHGVFGYNIVPESYYEAVISWFRRRHHWEIERSSILYTTAVVPAMSCVINRACYVVCHQGADDAWREGAHSLACLQLLLLID